MAGYVQAVITTMALQVDLLTLQLWGRVLHTTAATTWYCSNRRSGRVGGFDYRFDTSFPSSSHTV